MGKSREAAAAIITLIVYFAVLLVPRWMPSIQTTAVWFLYVLSIPLVLLSLIGVLIWGGFGTLASRRRDDAQIRPHHQRLIVSATGLVLFFVVFSLSRMIRGTLPTGSQLSAFDQLGWLDPASSEIVNDDITQRQKMLADVVNNVLPDRSCKEVESLLGPSLDTPYFQSTERDLIYILGPQRDSFMRIDFEWLLIWCDPSGRFERYEIFTD